MKTSETHRHRTRHSLRNSCPQPKTENYGKTSAFYHYQVALTCNNMQNVLPIDLVEETNSKVKESIHVCI